MFLAAFSVFLQIPSRSPPDSSRPVQTRPDSSRPMSRLVQTHPDICPHSFRHFQTHPDLYPDSSRPSSAVAAALGGFPLGLQLEEIPPECPPGCGRAFGFDNLLSAPERELIRSDGIVLVRPFVVRYILGQGRMFLNELEKHRMED